MPGSTGSSPLTSLGSDSGKEDDLPTTKPGNKLSPRKRKIGVIHDSDDDEEDDGAEGRVGFGTSGLARVGSNAPEIDYDDDEEEEEEDDDDDSVHEDDDDYVEEPSSKPKAPPPPPKFNLKLKMPARPPPQGTKDGNSQTSLSTTAHKPPPAKKVKQDTSAAAARSNSNSNSNSSGKGPSGGVFKSNAYVPGPGARPFKSAGTGKEGDSPSKDPRPFSSSSTKGGGSVVPSNKSGLPPRQSQQQSSKPLPSKTVLPSFNKTPNSSTPSNVPQPSVNAPKASASPTVSGPSTASAGGAQQQPSPASALTPSTAKETKPPVENGTVPPPRPEEYDLQDPRSWSNLFNKSNAAGAASTNANAAAGGTGTGATGGSLSSLSFKKTTQKTGSHQRITPNKRMYGSELEQDTEQRRESSRKARENDSDPGFDLLRQGLEMAHFENEYKETLKRISNRPPPANPNHMEAMRAQGMAMMPHTSFGVHLFYNFGRT